MISLSILAFAITPCKCNESVDISDGIYIIRSALNKNKVLDIQGGENKNYQNLQLYDFNNTDAQKFYIHKLDDGFYEIQSLCSNKLLEVHHRENMCGANVYQFQRRKSDFQKWKFFRLPSGHVSIISKLGNLNLDVDNGSIRNSTNIQVWTPNQTDAQKFILDCVKTFNTKDYFISTDKSKMKIERLKELLKQNVSTCEWNEQKIKSVIENTPMCFGIYDKNENQVGFARAITDYETSCFISSVVIDKTLRGKGLGTFLTRSILEHPELKKCSFSLIPASPKVAKMYNLLGFTSTGWNYMKAPAL